MNWGHADFQSAALPTELSRRKIEARSIRDRAFPSTEFNFGNTVFCAQHVRLRTDVRSRSDRINEWLSHYNFTRPHQGKEIGNKVLNVDFTPTIEGEIKCEQRLGGVISWYYRDAA